jgi:hypothetical protein
MVVEEDWTFAAVEERLVEAMRLWWRSPGGGRWPFAKDAPWHLMSKDRNQGDYDDQHGNEDARRKSLPLTRAEIAERDAVSEWLRIVPDKDRRLVVLVLNERARGQARIRWSAIRKRLEADIGPRGLGMRYSRAITAIVRQLKSRKTARLGVKAVCENA